MMVAHNSPIAYEDLIIESQDIFRLKFDIDNETEHRNELCQLCLLFVYITYVSKVRGVAIPLCLNYTKLKNSIT